jgi:hypothetical protein
VLQSAALAFMNELPFPPGPWDEISMWLGFEKNGKSNSANQKNEITSPISLTSYSHSSALLRNETNHSWVNLRVSQYRSRPAHADQLHLDLWWQGMNLAQDAGTYLYNASPPWDNSLAGTEHRLKLCKKRLVKVINLLWQWPNMTDIKKLASSTKGP